jgi:hypothetical protein
MNENKLKLVTVLKTVHILNKGLQDLDPTPCHKFPDGLPLYAVPFEGTAEDITCAKCLRGYIEQHLSHQLLLA